MTTNKDSSGEQQEVFRKISLDQLEIGKWNVRKREIAVDIDELARSLQKIGLQQPIVVQPKNGKFEIIIGQRRFLAAKQLEWKSIDAKVRTERLDEFDSKVLSFSENVQRRDISPRDKADTCVYLLQKLETPAKVAEHIGTTEQTVRKWLGYAGVPNKLKTLVEEKVLSVPVAMRLSEYVQDEDKAVNIAIRMSKEPKATRDRIMESAEEIPKRSVDSILKRAEEKKRQKKITFVLPEKWSYAMDRAARRLNTTANDIARDATVEWLQMMRY